MFEFHVESQVRESWRARAKGTEYRTWPERRIQYLCNLNKVKSNSVKTWTVWEKPIGPPPRGSLGLTCLKVQPNMSAKWRNPHHSLGRPFRTTASSKNSVAVAWAWFTRPKTHASIVLSP